MSPLKARIKKALGKETLTAFVDRIDIARGTLYAAFTREELTGAHTLDEATARRVAEGLGKSLTWVYEGADGPAEEKPRPPTAHEADPATEDAMRWRALCELTEDGESTADAFEALSTAQFDRSKQQPSWGDYYALAKRHLKRRA